MVEASTDAQQREDESPCRITQQPTVLQAADGIALACGQRCRAPLNGPGIPPADNLKTPPSEHRQHQAQRHAEAQAELPGSTGT